jgi:hypothetical protein
MSRYTWGVDASGRCSLTENCKDILICGINGVNGYALRDYYEGFEMAGLSMKVEVSAVDLKVVKDILFLLEKYKTELPAPLLNQLEAILDEKAKPTERDRMISLVNDVANIGVDFGYGEFFIDQSHIEKARNIIKEI